MSKPLILGISGFAGSGKDTLAEFLAPAAFVRVALADPLKRIAQQVYAFTDVQLWGPSAERSKVDLRYPRNHTWSTRKEGETDVSCACCGEVGHYYQVEENLWLISTEDAAPCYLTPRYALQLLGTEWGRHCFEDTWVQTCLRTAQTLLDPKTLGVRYTAQRGVYSGTHLDEDGNPNQGVAIPDVRFQSEIDAIHEAGGKVLRIVRPVAGLKGAMNYHASEAEMASIPDSVFDAVLVNDGSLDDLKVKGLAAAESLR